MFCKNCGNPLPDNSKFCQNCGTPVDAPVSVQPAPKAASSKRNIIILVVTLAVLIAGAVIAVIVTGSGDNSAAISETLTTAERFLSEEKYEEAIIEFDKILKIDEFNVDAYLGKAEALCALGREDEAREVLEEAAEIIQDEADLGLIMEALEDLDEDEAAAVTTTTATQATTSATTTTAATTADEPQETTEAADEEYIPHSGYYLAEYDRYINDELQRSQHIEDGMYVMISYRDDGDNVTKFTINPDGSRGANTYRSKNGTVRVYEKIRMFGNYSSRQMISQIDDSKRIDYSFERDENGNVIRKISTRTDSDGNTSTSVFTFSFETDEQGRVTKFTECDADGNVIDTTTISYNARGQITEERFVSEEETYVVTIEYYDNGREKTITENNVFTLYGDDYSTYIMGYREDGTLEYTDSNEESEGYHYTCREDYNENGLISTYTSSEIYPDTECTESVTYDEWGNYVYTESYYTHDSGETYEYITYENEYEFGADGTPVNIKCYIVSETWNDITDGIEDTYTDNEKRLRFEYRNCRYITLGAN